MPKKRLNTDSNYDPDVNPTPNKKRRGITRGSNVNKFLDDHADEIVRMHRNGTKPKDIAAALCAQEGIASNATTGKKVSGWINYRKKSGQLKTYSVSADHNNLKAEKGHNCILFFCL